MSIAIPSLRPATAVPSWAKNELWRKAQAVPSLDLRFADSKSLVDATTGQNLVTFTRASSGTYVDSNGLIKTATTNLLLRSEEFDQSPWGAASSSVTPDATISPYGTTSADLFVPNSGVSISGNGNFHNIRQSITLISDTIYTLSFYLKAGGYSVLRFGLSSQNNLVNNYSDITVNLNTLTVTQTLGTGSITPIGGGWYRVTATGTATSTTGFAVCVVADGGTADGTSGIYLWGAQLEQSSTVGEYIPTTSTKNSAPRFDHDPITGECLGLLVEEQRTNYIDDSSFQDFSIFATSNQWINQHPELDSTSNHVASPDGGTNAASLYINTATGYKYTYYRTGLATGTDYVFSVFAKAGAVSDGVTLFLGGDTFTNFVRAYFTLAGNGSYSGSTSNGTAVVANDPTIQAVGNGWYRCTIYATFTSPTNITSLIYPGVYSSQAEGTTTYLWGAQLEAGSFPTSYIPTEGATKDRSEDVVSITGTNFSSWYRQDEGTVFSEANFTNTVSYNTVFNITDGTSSERIRTIQWNDGLSNRILSYTSSGVDQANFVGTAVNGKTKNTGAYKVNDFAAVQDGGLVQTDTSGTVSTLVNSMDLGSTSGVFVLNGTISRLTYWPTRLPNETLQGITV